MATMKRRMTLPSIVNRDDPIYKPAERPPSDPGHQAVFIFAHGLGDSAEGKEGIVDQFQSGHKLPHMHWILPNAMRNHEVGATAWFTPKATKLEKGEDEDESGMLESVAYLESLIDACRNKGIPESRIVLGGFSQGCAISLLTDLVSRKYSGRLAGIVGLMGQIPLVDGRRINDLRAQAGLPPTTGEVPIFLTHGRTDHLIDHSRWALTLEKLASFQGTAVESKEYAHLGHSLDDQVLGDMCTFLERIVPNLED